MPFLSEQEKQVRPISMVSLYSFNYYCNFTFCKGHSINIGGSLEYVTYFHIYKVVCDSLGLFHVNAAGTTLPVSSLTLNTTSQVSIAPVPPAAPAPPTAPSAAPPAAPAPRTSQEGIGTEQLGVAYVGPLI